MHDRQHAPHLTTGDTDTSPALDDGPLFRVQTLGALALTAADAPTDAPALLPIGKPLALLAYCMADRRPHSRDALCALLWADAAPDRARHNLRQALWRLRRVLGELITVRDDAVWAVSGRITSDRDDFLDAVSREDVDAVLRTYQGEYLPNLSLPGGDEFDEWLALERVRLERMVVRVVAQARVPDRARSAPFDVRDAVQRLIARAPQSVDARRLAVDLLVDRDSLTDARREADALEALALRMGGGLAPEVRATIDRARRVAHNRQSRSDAAVHLELVGRDDAFGTVLSQWALAMRGDPQVVTISGVAGVGKSRLAHAIAARCRGRNARSLVVRANPGERHLPFGFLATLVRALCALPGAAGISGESAREFVALDPALREQFQTSAAVVDEESGRRRAHALQDLLQAITEQQPLALFLDDFHWVDGQSQRMIASTLDLIGSAPLLAVLTHRSPDAAVVLPERGRVLRLESLEPDALIDAISATGTWPDAADARRFVAALAEASDGIPFDVVERLTIAIDTGIVRFEHGVWSAPDWHDAVRRVGELLPTTQRLAHCTRDERAALLLLGLAGVPLDDALLTDSPWREHFFALETRDLVRCERGQWLPTHDLLVDHAISESDTDARKRAHSTLGALLDRDDDASAKRASMHFSLAGDLVSARETFGRVVREARRRHDARSVRELVHAVLGEHATPERLAALETAVPLSQRDPRLRMRMAFAAIAAIALVSATVGWNAWRTPHLQILQSPLITRRANLFGNNAVRLTPSLIVATAEPGEAGDQIDTVHASIVSGADSIVAGGAVVAHNGQARFGGLRIVTKDSIVHLRFTTSRHRPLDVRVSTSDDADVPGTRPQLQLIEARVKVGRTIQTLHSIDSAAVVPPDALIEGILQAQYTAPWSAASVWVSMTPSWGSAAEVGRDLTPVTTPVSAEEVDLPFTMVAPRTPGVHYVMFILAAEPSGGFALSQTNWLVERPIWGDGNDIASLPSPVIREASRRGMLRSMIAYPKRWRKAERACVPRDGQPELLYCPMEFAFLAIPIIVK